MESNKNRRGPAIKAAILIIFLVTAIVIARFTPLREHLTAEKLRLLLEMAGPWAPVAYIGAYAAPLSAPGVFSVYTDEFWHGTHPRTLPGLFLRHSARHHRRHIYLHVFYGNNQGCLVKRSVGRIAFLEDIILPWALCLLIFHSENH